MWLAWARQAMVDRRNLFLKVLGLDTACGACSAAVWNEDAITAGRFEHRARGHAEALMPMVQAVMHDASLAYDALDAIAVTRGPGTFTGLRIGLAAARGLALAANLPLFGLTTLEVIAAGARAELPGYPILTAIDARRDQVYAQLFQADGTPVGDPAAMSLAAAADMAGGKDLVCAGDMAEQLAALRNGSCQVAPGTGQPDAAVLAPCAAQRPLPGPGTPVSPLYLRAPDAKLPGGIGLADEQA